MKNICKIIALAAIALTTSNCATNLTKPKSSPQPAKVKFSEFKKVEMKAVGINPKFATHGANQKALRKIDEKLSENLRVVFPNFKKLEVGQEFSKTKDRTLQITPYVKEIKFIGGAARFWAGAIAGSSAVLMQVTFVDSATGKVISDPEFYRDAGAYSGAWSFGGTDNGMLSEVSKDIASYASYNK